MIDPSFEFARGHAEARDPVRQADEPHVTTLRSCWLARTCPACSHTFRTNDPVHRDDDGVVRHAGRGLGGAPGMPPAAPAADEAGAFYAGLDEALPTPAGVVIAVLTERHFLAAAPLGNHGRRRCLVCAHTFRPGDRVVVCPCRPGAPICEAAVHRDPVNGLFCLEGWSPGGGQVGCPVTSRRAQ